MSGFMDLILDKKFGKIKMDSSSSTDSIPSVTQNVHRASVSSPDNISLSDEAESTKEDFKLNDDDDDDKLLMPGQDSGSQSLTNQDPFVGESFPGWRQMDLQNALNNPTITSKNNQASGVNSLQNRSVSQVQLHKPTQELDGKSITLRTGTCSLAQQPQSHHLVRPSTSSFRHGSTADSKLLSRANRLARLSKRFRPYQLANIIQTNLTPSSQVVSLAPHAGQTNPYPVQAPPHQVIRPTGSRASDVLYSSSTVPQTIPTVLESYPVTSSAMHQTVWIQPTISDSLSTTLPETPSTLPFSHKTNLQIGQSSKKSAPTQNSPYHPRKCRAGDSDKKHEGQKCSFCMRDLCFPPEGPIGEPSIFAVSSSVLACGHTFACSE